MAKHLVTVHFHHEAESVAVLIEAADATGAENAAWDAFEYHEDWAIQAVEYVRPATAEDEAIYQAAESFC